MAKKRDAADVELVGADNFKRDLEKLGDAMRKTLSDAVEEGAKIVEEDARMRAPVKSGTLRREIIRKKGYQTQTAAPWDVGPSKKAFYGRFVEYGTRFISAQPFLRPAFDSNVERVREEIRKHLKRTVDRTI